MKKTYTKTALKCIDICTERKTMPSPNIGTNNTTINGNQFLTREHYAGPWKETANGLWDEE